MKNQSRRARGFTLIEVLVTISIIAIIISVSYSSFNSAKAKGRDAKRISDTEQINTALTSYNLDHGGVPAASASAGCLGSPDGITGPTWVCGTDASIATVLAPLVSGHYIASIPTDPVDSNGVAYYYTTAVGTFDARTGIYLAPGASFSYVSEAQTSSYATPYVSTKNIGTPDYITYPTTGYPAGGAAAPWVDIYVNFFSHLYGQGTYNDTIHTGVYSSLSTWYIYWNNQNVTSCTVNGSTPTISGTWTSGSYSIISSGYPNLSMSCTGPGGSGTDYVHLLF